MSSMPPPPGPQPTPPPPGGNWQQYTATYHHAAPNHPSAVTALVLGIVGLAVCGVCGPFAWVIGQRAVKEIDASAGRLGGRGLAQAGFVMGIVSTALLAVMMIVLILFVIGGLGAATQMR